VVVIVVMLGAILTEFSWSELLAAQPLAPFGDPGLDWAIAVELSLGVGFSWWTIMGNLARLTTRRPASGPRPRRSLGATAGQGTAEGPPAPQSMEAVTCGNVGLGKAQSVGVLSRAPSG